MSEMSLNQPTPVHARWGTQGWVGLVLLAAAWPVAWLQLHPFSDYIFFVLWLGYILVADALVLRRRGTSPLTRNPVAWVLMFVISTPFWQLFELFNRYLQNWHYIGADAWPLWKVNLVESLDFSTVIPAVLTTAELVASFEWIKRLRMTVRLPVKPAFLLGSVLLGAVMVAGVITVPRYAFPFTWIALFLMLDPMAYALKRPSIFGFVARGEWRPIVALALAGVICGFFWEMWNYLSMPKWYYTVPVVGFLKIFEMPILGYGGYLPFALEVFSMYQVVAGLLRLSSGTYIHIESET